MFNIYKNISKLNDVSSIAFIYEDEYTVELIMKLYELNLYKEFQLYTSSDRLYKKTVKSLSEKRKYHEKFNTEINTVCIRTVNLENLQSDLIFLDTKVPWLEISNHTFDVAHLFIHIWCDSLPYFTLWEKNRDSCSHIFIQRINEKGKPETLDWYKEKENLPELSIVFPVYKVADYLPKCIESVTAWKAPYIEFLFIDDGSPDNSAAIIEKYQKYDNRIKLIQKENGGCASARKFGLELARGRYVGFVDPDDFVEPNMFKKLFSRAIMGMYQICFSGYNFYYESTKMIEPAVENLALPYSEGTIDLDEIRNMLISHRVAIWRAIYRKDYLEKNKITFNTDFKRFDDLPFKIETLIYAKSVASVPEYLYYYRLNRPGQDVACNDKRLYVHFDIFSYLDEIVLRINDQKIIDYLQIVKFQTHLWGLSLIQMQYAREYAKRAREDILKNCSKKRTGYLIYKYLGKKQLKSFFDIVNLNIKALKK